MPQEMVRKNAMLTVVNPAIDPLGPLAFDLERRIQARGCGMVRFARRPRGDVRCVFFGHGGGNAVWEFQVLVGFCLFNVQLICSSGKPV